MDGLEEKTWSCGKAGAQSVYNGVGMDVQIPAFAGMTECPREREGRCVYNGVGMDIQIPAFAGMTACPKGARRTMCVQWSANDGLPRCKPDRLFKILELTY